MFGCVQQAMRDASLKAVVTECSTLIGCFVPCEETLPLLLHQLQAAAEPAAATAVLNIVAAIIAGAGRLGSSLCNVAEVSKHMRPADLMPDSSLHNVIQFQTCQHGLQGQQLVECLIRQNTFA